MITPSFSLTATERVLPKLALDFTTAALDPRVTFTRTTSASNPATYVNSSGVITAATNNQPRFDYNPVTLACKGLLIEESRTNLLFPSDAAPWGFNVIGGDIVTNNAGTAPDGTNTAASISPRLGSSSRLDKVFTLTSGVTYSITFYSNYSGGGSGSPFSLQTLVNATVVSNFVATDAGNGWYRQTASFTTTSTSVTVRLYWTNFTTGTCLIWGAQLEAGAFATSYIPTTTTALTRNADVATMTGTNFSSWFNASAGAIEMQALVKDLGSSIYPGWLAIDDGTTNNEALIIYAYVTGVTSLVRHSSANTFSLNRNGILSSTPSVVKALLSYANSDFKATYQGATPATQASGTIPSGLVQMRIGVYSSRQINGHIQKINYWPQSLQTAEVQAFTK